MKCLELHGSRGSEVSVTLLLSFAWDCGHSRSELWVVFGEVLLGPVGLNCDLVEEEAVGGAGRGGERERGQGEEEEGKGSAHC